MNLIKFKDIFLETSETVSEEEAQWFNSHLKGKYAYALNWQWIVPFDGMTVSEFVEASKANTPGEVENYPISVFQDYVDVEFTDKANSIDKYVYLNQFSSDSDITLEDLKKFRTWLAESILSIKDPDRFVQGESTMLEYYKNHMYDSTIESLSIFAQVTTTGGVVASQSCGCLGKANTGLLGISTTVCDPVGIYRKGIYDLMVNLWSHNEYWTDLESDDFLVEFKKYVDGIIQYNLPLFTTDWTTVFADCTCVNSNDSLQAAGLAAMRALSQALQYLIDGDTTGHKNFIDSAFRVFASQYYERMEWV